ncbi:VOC family protein [Paenibacillus sp. HJGM_3]|uniref:VOC family protein n=1 Tax=Paenibacillus sp. HJGM_3 TaxID=3379816 RepID=UPI00385AC2D9
MKKLAKPNHEENFQPQRVTQAFKVLKGNSGNNEGLQQNEPILHSTGLESAIDLVTLVQLPARKLAQTVSFYAKVLGLELEYPERPIERNTFLRTVPRTAPGLHILETPEMEFRHLHGTVNGRLQEYLALYIKDLAVLKESLSKAGADILVEPTNGYMSFFDPEGHLIGAYERTEAGIDNCFETNITGFRHVQMHVSDPASTAVFFENALGLRRFTAEDGSISMGTNSNEKNQPVIRLVQQEDPANPLPMHWILHGRPKHALELHSKNIGALAVRVLENGGTVKEELEFGGCGGYLKLYTPDGHYLWVNQNVRYSDGYKPERVPAPLIMMHRKTRSEVQAIVMEDMKPYVVEHGDLKLIGIPCISLQDMSGKYRHAKEGLLSSAKHLPSVKNPFIQYGIWPEADTQGSADLHAYILCVEVESFEGIPEWYFRTTLPPQKCVVVANKQGDFNAASLAVDQYIRERGMEVGSEGRKYIICERYNDNAEGFARYSLPIQ